MLRASVGQGHISPGKPRVGQKLPGVNEAIQAGGPNLAGGKCSHAPPQPSAKKNGSQNQKQQRQGR